MEAQKAMFNPARGKFNFKDPDTYIREQPWLGIVHCSFRIAHLLGLNGETE